MSQRIYWTDEEKDSICQFVFDQLMKEPTASVTSLVYRAMQQMPKERQRDIQSAISLPWLIDFLKDRFGEFRQLSHRLKESQDRIDDLTLRLRSKEPPKVDMEALKKEIIASLTVEELKLESMKREAETLTTINNGIRSIMGALSTLISRSSSQAPVQVKKPSIVLVGYLPDQENMFRQEYGEFFRLNFIPADRSDKTLPDADYAILTKMIGHCWQDVAFKKFPRDKVHVVDGIMTSTRQILDSLTPVLKR